MIKFVDKFKMYGEDELSFASINQAKEMNKTPQERYDKENTMRVSLKLNKSMMPISWNISISPGISRAR